MKNYLNKVFTLKKLKQLINFSVLYKLGEKFQNQTIKEQMLSPKAIKEGIPSSLKK